MRHAGRLLHVAALRLIRDVRVVAALIFVFAVPVAMSRLVDPTAVNALLLTALVLPLAVGWYWGEDLADGRLIVYAVGSVGRLSLLVCRVAVFLGATAVLSLAVAFVSGEAVNKGVLFVVPCYMVCVGFLLATLLRSSASGWITWAALILGLFLPMRLTGDAGLLVKMTTIALLPSLGLGRGWFDSSDVVLAQGAFAIIALVISVLVLVRRPGAFGT